MIAAVQAPMSRKAFQQWLVGGEPLLHINGEGNYGFNIDAKDRRNFEQLFGRHASYTAEDITRITYGRNKIYEAPPVQAEDMAEGMVMGGMV